MMPKSSSVGAETESATLNVFEMPRFCEVKYMHYSISRHSDGFWIETLIRPFPRRFTLVFARDGPRDGPIMWDCDERSARQRDA